jgi:GT2 family glycosyltransferase
LKPLVAIIILNWNGKNYLEQFLPSVLASTYLPLNIVLADNASTDDSIVFVRTHYPQITIITLSQNFGFAKGYNEALKKVKADYYVLLNSDVAVSSGWIEPIIALMEKDRAIGACQPKILMQSNKSMFEYAGAAGGWIDYLGYPFARGRIFDVCEEDKGQYQTNEKIFWASGAAFFISTNAYHAMGGFDEYFFAHQEEIDLCWRLQLAGYSIMVCPTSEVYHVGGGTLPKGNRQKVYLNFRNNLIMLFKNLSLSTKWYIILIRLCLDAIAAWKALLTQGQINYFLGVAQAHIGFFYWVLCKQSKSIFPASKIALPQGMLHASIVWQYFIKKRRKFSEILPHNS